MTITRRPATAQDLVVGARVFKGQGKTEYRIWAVRHGMASVVKVTTAKDPSRGCFYGPAKFTVKTGPTSSPAPIRLNVTVNLVDLQDWTDTYGVEGFDAIQEDVRRYVKTLLDDAFANGETPADVTVR